MESDAKRHGAVLLDLTSFVPSLELAHDECNEYWHPETPPLATIFGEFGHQLMKSFPQMSLSERASVFSLIEAGIFGGSEELQTGLQPACWRLLQIETIGIPTSSETYWKA